MSKNVITRILLIAASVLILIGVALTVSVLVGEPEGDVIKVRLRNGSTEIVEFKDLSLVPGGKCEYVIHLENTFSDRYDLTLDFIEGEETTLKNYVRVRIENDEQTVCDESLAVLLSGEPISLAVDFDEGKNEILTVTYYMPVEVGSEAANAEALFELQITASNK